MEKLKNINRNYERMFWIGLVILMALFYYGEVRHQKRVEDLEIDIHGTYESQQVSDHSGKPYPKTYMPLYFVFNSEDNSYMIHMGGPIIEFGTYEKSKFVKNVFYIKSDDGRENFIEVNPVTNTFAYSFDNDSDDVREFVWHARSMYLGYFENERK